MMILYIRRQIDLLRVLDHLARQTRVIKRLSFAVSWQSSRAGQT